MKAHTRTSICCVLALGIVLPSSIVSLAQDVTKNTTTTKSQLQLSSPTPFEVVQREGFDPAHSSAHEPNGPARGFAMVLVKGDSAVSQNAIFEARVVAADGAWGQGFDWTKLDVVRNGNSWSGTVKVLAGGWYRLEVRSSIDGKTVATSSVEPFGVGEVFVIAGQSYASGANDELLNVDDPKGRVVAFDPVTKAWRTANDPQPNHGDGGTIWPALGNYLLPLVQVPIGFVNVAVGGTASRQWMPGEQLYKNLSAAGREVGRFRAVLWQQGESDVIEKIDTDTYVKRLIEIRSRVSKEWGFEPIWLPAKSTLHPTVYNDPAGEGRIRTAIDQLWQTPGFRPGPDTDILDGENRGGPMTRRHFSGTGQRRAGLMWFAAVWNELNRRRD